MAGVESVESRDSLLEALAATPEVSVLPRGTVIDDQYRIERVIGEGGMGVVHLARDLRLARDVAIKVSSERSEASLGRLAREALALARLSHPNVVTIHQVGVTGGRPYVAMEYVPGGTARTWCTAERSWREIVALYCGAGDGLVAAHAEAIIHRDFKPDNVLVGSDGRSRVADFGLARAPVEAAAGTTTTTTTAVAGTPAYMPPEQLAGGELDARADQFAFCASLWEALFATRPFTGDTPDTMRQAIVAGAIERGVATRRVPRHVEAAVRRGLSADRDARWPALADLLAELRRDPGRRRVQLVIAAGGLAAIAAALVLPSLVRGRSADPCAGGATELATVWSPSRADAVRAAIAPANSAPWIVQIAARTTGAIDAWGERWTSEYRTVCEARTTWSSALHDRAVACLAGRKRELSAQLDVLAVPQPGLATRVDRVLGDLPAPESCGEPVYLEASVPPTDDPAVLGAQTELARAHALSVVGEPAKGRMLATTVRERADKLGYPALVHQATAQLALANAIAGDYEHAYAGAHDAYFGARASHDSRTAAAAASTATLMLLNLSRDREAADWAKLAEIEAKLAGDPDSEERALRAAVTVEADRGELAQALADAERYLALARKHGGVWSALLERARIYNMNGKPELALADLDEAIRLLTAQFGEHHPQMTALVDERALALDRLDRFEDSVAAARHALAIAEVIGEHDVNNALAALGTALDHAGHFDEALATLDRSLAMTRKLEGPRSYNTASDLNNRADLLARMHRLEPALASWAEAIDIWTEVGGPKMPEIAVADINVANAYINAGMPLPAAEWVDRTLAIAAPDSFVVPQAKIANGVVLVAKRDFAAARPALEAGLAKLPATSGGWKARGELALAKAEAAIGDRKKAHALAASAVAYYQTAKEQNKEQRAEAEALLRELP